MRSEQVFGVTYDGRENLTIGRVGNGYIIRRTVTAPAPGHEQSVNGEIRVAETPDRLAEIVKGWAETVRAEEDKAVLERAAESSGAEKRA